ncbi:hypothetical protein F2Q70_00023556 [Brassica cretica]|uniref:Uncharacterized protein n=1 Tax=Brassica cretica TaxID=69181 RepID=A0A8S9GQL3_BRACR|nr:hypothetical protein F2Q70_00023556 [Brassica cretica]
MMSPTSDVGKIMPVPLPSATTVLIPNMPSPAQHGQESSDDNAETSSSSSSGNDSPPEKEHTINVPPVPVPDPANSHKMPSKGKAGIRMTELSEPRV